MSTGSSIPSRSHARAAIAAALFAVGACRGSSNDTTGGGGAALKVTPDSVTVVQGSTAQLTATLSDDGSTAAGVTWTSLDPSRVTVSSSGLVTAVSPGRVVVTAGAGGVTGTAIVRSAVDRDVSVVDAQFTQGAQALDGSIPIILSGDAAVLNVLLSSTPAARKATTVVLRLFDAGGAPLRIDTLPLTVALDAAPSYTSPSAQFLIPAGVLAGVGSWQVAVDPAGVIPDRDPSDDVFPRAGRATLSKVTVPPLDIRFVPIVQTLSGATGTVTAAQLPEYLRTVRALHPLGIINATIGMPFSTTANFGTPPSGGASAFWLQVLAELDLARAADTTNPNAYWMGILVPPDGFNFTAFGGFGYIPGAGSTRGPGTRTAVAVQLGWFSRATQARDGIAHELGHNFGRQHAPCGSPASPDPLFPDPSGQIGKPGHDVYSWATGTAASALVLPAQTGDLMGYCTPVWISEYTYRGEMQFRGAAASLRAPVAAVRSLVVHGAVSADNHVTLAPSFTLVARPALPERPGPFVLTGRDSSGTTLFSYSFAPSVIDHSTTFRHFALVIPITVATEEQLRSLSVTGPGGSASLSAPIGRPLRSGDGNAASARVVGARSVDVNCGDAAAILVRDAASGDVLGTARGAALRVVAAPGASLTVSCSDGVRTTTHVLIAGVGP